ncbi:MAG: 1-deoxy-D-xylulose-5-phosphate synthase [Actinobacteria bacterium]|nr:1-deoxy-D-xylulose-5-phosphate synthase [Actinomycetota bacterium]
MDSPDDLKKLTIEELKTLSSEIREYLVDVVSKNGGHLAPNLGIVELTIALHYVLNSPKDRIIFDVSHQSYVHKILTGRRELFKTLRQFGGISGFTSIQESEHDFYTTGHASTSLAFAMGLQEAMIREGSDGKVVAVIGDGALTGGVAFEALNNIGHLRIPLLIVLNDNEMSIAKNVGAISSYLSRIRLDPKYNRLREDIERALKSFPIVGDTIYQIGEQLRESLKALLTPGILFEEFGIRYFGPVDGHNLERLILAIKWASELNEPVLLHVITKKGKGYLPAEEHPEYFHGSAPFDIKTGKPIKKSQKKTYTEVFSEALVEIASRNEKVLAITAAMPSGTGLDKFRDKFKDRFFDVGIAEQFAVSFAAGLARGGYRPVCAIYSTFLQRAYDQVIEDVALNNLPVIFAIDRGGIVGEDGATHHGAFDISYLRCVPRAIIGVPTTGRDLVSMLKAAIKVDNPFFFRYPRGEIVDDELDSFDDIEEAKIGKGRYLKKGEKIAIIGLGRPVYEALKAATMLEQEGIHITVFDALWVKPIDEEEIAKILANHHIVITLEENNIQGGFGELVARLAAEKSLKPPVAFLGIRDVFLPHGKTDELLHITGIDSEKIAETVKSFTKKTNGEIFKKIASIFRINGSQNST